MRDGLSYFRKYMNIRILYHLNILLFQYLHLVGWKCDNVTSSEYLIKVYNFIIWLFFYFNICTWLVESVTSSECLIEISEVCNCFPPIFGRATIKGNRAKLSSICCRIYFYNTLWADCICTSVVRSSIQFNASQYNAIRAKQAIWWIGTHCNNIRLWNRFLGKAGTDF